MCVAHFVEISGTSVRHIFHLDFGTVIRHIFRLNCISVTVVRHQLGKRRAAVAHIFHDASPRTKGEPVGEYSAAENGDSENTCVDVLHNKVTSQ